MKVEDLVVIKVEAEGYYSNSYVRCEVIVEKSFVEEYFEEFGSTYFHELDGKHSEIKGELTTLVVTRENLRSIVSSYMSAEGDDYQIWGGVLDGIPEEVLEKQIQIDRLFCEKADLEVITKYFFEGEEL